MAPKRTDVDKGKRPLVETEAEQPVPPRWATSDIAIGEPTEVPGQGEQAPHVEPEEQAPVPGETLDDQVPVQRATGGRRGRPRKARRGAATSMRPAARAERQRGVGQQAGRQPDRREETMPGPSTIPGPSMPAPVVSALEGVSQQMSEMMRILSGVVQRLDVQGQRTVPMDPSPSTVPGRQAQAPAQTVVHEASGTGTELEDEARQMARRQEERADMRAFQGLNPPPFSGSGDYRDAEAWIAEMEKLFRFHQCQEHLKVRYATFTLRGEAEIWWRSVIEVMPDLGEGMSWPEFVRTFYEQFFPDSERDRRAEEFARLE